MSRPPRIEFPGAIYHVTSRGDGPAPVYRDDVQTILDARCAACHSAPSPKGGWSSVGFFGAVSGSLGI